MNEDRSIRMLATAAAGFCGLSLLFFGLAIGFDPLAGAELVERIVETDPGDAGWIQWGAVTDMVGYYFLPLALMLVLRRRLGWGGAVADIATAGGVLYAAIGAAGAAILAATAPGLIEDRAAGELANVAQTVEGMWQWFEPIPFATWAAGMSIALRGPRPAVARLFALLSAAAIGVLVAHLVEADILLAISLTIWLGLLPILLATAGLWTERTGSTALRRPL